jgi:eukaryotic-like serine/threonine-protein kinase
MPDPAADDPGELLRMLRNDQRMRWQQGERIPVEAYLEHFPQLQADAGALLALVEHELTLRAEAGEEPRLEDFCRRFPQFAERWRRDWPRTALTLEHVESLSDDSRLTLHSESPASAAWISLPEVPGYEVLGALGYGGMGVVYQARQRGLDRLVALKMLRAGLEGPRALARFRAEAEAIARIQHPNIVQIYEVGDYEGQPFLALEFVPGGSLATKLRGEPQPPRAAAELVELLAWAVAAVHERGVVHRDLKPANVLLAPPPATPGDYAAALERYGQPKVTDFGLAKRLDIDRGHTQTGAVLGTPGYMTPEQAAGRKTVGPTTDVWALGAILYECLTGRPPFRGETPVETVMQVLHDDPVPVRQLRPELPRDLETITLKCLRKEAAERYATAADLAADLRRFRQGEPVLGRPPSAAQRLWRWLRKRRELVFLVVGAMAATGVLLALWALGGLGR